MTISRCEGDIFIASLEEVVRGARQRGAFPNRETFQHGVYGTMDARRARSLVLAVPKEGRRVFRTIDHERAGASVGRPSVHTHDAHAARARASKTSSATSKRAATAPTSAAETWQQSSRAMARRVRDVGPVASFSLRGSRRPPRGRTTRDVTSSVRDGPIPACFDAHKAGRPPGH